MAIPSRGRMWIKSASNSAEAQVYQAKVPKTSLLNDMAREALWRRPVDEAAVPFFLDLGENFNRHGVSSKERFSRQPQTTAETFRNGLKSVSS